MTNVALPDEAHQALQAQTLKVMAALMPRGTKVALIDFPNHRNHGDHLIFKGEMAYLARLGVDVAYIADPSRYNVADLQHFVPTGLVLLHGGGSFGDRWTETQRFRERVISENMDRRVIQLSQGIEFSPGPALETAQAVYSAHRDLIHLIRDYAGAAKTRELFPSNTVTFCPDMALGNERYERVAAPIVAAVFLKREDSEGLAGMALSLRDMSAVQRDWGFSLLEELAWKALHIPGAIANRASFLRRRLYPIQRLMYLAMAELNIRSARRIVGKGQIVVTDRLHAAVFGFLSRRQVLLLDNANGKTAAIANDYLHRLGVQHFDDPSTCQSALEALATRD